MSTFLSLPSFSAHTAWTGTGPRWRHGQAILCVPTCQVRVHVCVCVLHSGCISDFGVYINFLAPPTSCNLGTASPGICPHPRVLPTSPSLPSAPPPDPFPGAPASPVLGTPCFCVSLGAVWAEGETLRQQGACCRPRPLAPQPSRSAHDVV